MYHPIKTPASKFRTRMMYFLLITIILLFVIVSVALQTTMINGPTIFDSIRPHPISSTQDETPLIVKTRNETPLIITTQNERTVFSQNGEDGVIETIFDQIGVTDRFFVEFGVENGSQTNSRRLREEEGWTGLMMDGGNDNPSINLHREMIYHSNIAEHFKKYKVPMTFDLLSTDTDFKDFWISKAILDEGYRPRVIVSEINSAFEKGLTITVPRDIEQSRWSASYYFGASPMAMSVLYREYGYSLVFCESRGVNCFWVQNSQLSDDDVTEFNQQQKMLDTIQCARYGGNQGAHPTDLSAKNWWQEIIENADNDHFEIRRFTASNKELDGRRCH